MNLKLLIDGIVRQTTVLIAQISTSSGVRAPLSHVADQVFLELAREIEAQGVGRRVTADMFGMALRAYQKKMQRLTESASARERTLWEAVLSFIGEGEVTRARIEERFKHDGPRELAAVLNDLVRSGLVYLTGGGEHAIYGLTRAEVRDQLQNRAALDSLANVAWLKVFRGEAQSTEQLVAGLAADPEQVRAAVDELIASGRLRRGEHGLESANVVLPLGTEQGWEAAILDHFRAVAVAIGTKVRGGSVGAHESDRVGGSTFTFTVHAEHPCAGEVYALLRATRARVQELWDRVSAYNEAHPPDDTAVRLTFYLGQTVEQQGAEPDAQESR